MAEDHGLFGYSAIVDRSPLRWPGGARVAVWPVVYLEGWEAQPPAGAVAAPEVQGPWPVIAPDHRTVGHREYGHRVGVFRVIELLDRLGLRATLAAGAAACERYDAVIEACLDRGWELVAHGTYATRMISSAMSEAEERRLIGESVAAVETHLGHRPRGWIGQDFGESPRTPGLVAEAGLDYIADWPNDEQPYRMNVGAPLVSLPYQAEWDDLQLLRVRQVAADRYPAIVKAAFACLDRDGCTSGRTMSLGIHPWLLGRPECRRPLEEALSFLSAQPTAWHATASEIVDVFAEQSR
jgi:allantoinase